MAVTIEPILVQGVSPVEPKTKKLLSCYGLLSKDVVALTIVVIAESWPV